VKQGIADADRLGVGGWSYGGILTNFVIAKDTRFKSATSGASISNVLAGYGTDMYIREYEAELGTPWKNLDTWLHVSYPFLHADRIKTPTLFQCGASDFNVPLLNSEQMYQALRSLGVDTQLVIYPDQYHGLTKPSYLRERMQRYLDWHGKYLQKPRAEMTAR
jgi:dipeptidyl aminopeptidase/acylaminoacyl peptidase